MNKLWPTLTAAAVLVALPLPAAHAADPAPTNLEISWKDATTQTIHVRWDEDAPRPNEVYVRGSNTKFWRSYLPADGPNEVDIPIVALGTGPGPLQVGVVVGTSEQTTGTPALSARFGTTVPDVPTLVSVTPAGSGLTVKWQVPVRTDSTPNDPLDEPGTTYVPQYEVAGKTVPLAAASKALQATFANPVPSYTFSVRSQNPWGTETGARVNVRTAKLTAQLPARGLYGTETLIQGSYSQPVQERVVLQARNSATSAWYVVGTTVGNSSGKYAFPVTNRGTRQYRILTANAARGTEVWYGGSTAPVTLTTVQHITSANFYTPTIKRGQTATADLNVDPRFTGRVDLQRWNGKTWVHVKDVLITTGFARGQFVSTTPGRVAYRYYVPSTTANGLFVAAAYSPNFVLTTT
ncbi:hypothetical protein [Kribbella endophytica]